MVSKQRIEIKTLSNQTLYHYMKCPYKFYWKHIRGKEAQHIDWRERVQHVVNNIIKDFYHIPYQQRSTLEVLKLISVHWNIHTGYFDSKVHYYMVLAKVTDHLMQALMSQDSNEPPVFLFESFSTYSDELQINLSMTYQVGKWTPHSIAVKKFLIDEDEDIVQLYNHFCIVFSHQAFSVIPENIEVVSLLSGKRYIFTPTQEDLQISIQYLKMFKGLLEDSSSYCKTESGEECRTCPFMKQCRAIDTEVKFENISN